MTFHRYVALGDSFTEGVGDPDPSRPNGLRGWADRVADVLASQEPGFAYANLAIRGRKLATIIAEQVEPAIALGPDLVTIHGGGNDVLRPRVDLDALAASYDDTIRRLADSGAHVVMFTIQDPGPGGIYGPMRGRMAIFNEWVREIADTRGATVVDMWRMRDIDPGAVVDTDRLHLNSAGHCFMAGRVLEALGVDHDLVHEAEAPPALGRREQWRDNARWTREHLVPWVHRRVTGRSSGDGVSPKRPSLDPVN